MGQRLGKLAHHLLLHFLVQLLAHLAENQWRRDEHHAVQIDAKSHLVQLFGDLDGETLELLEERLVQFEGTVLLVSHDRMFLNNVVTSTIVFESDGVKEYDGGYDDWLRQRPEPVTETPSVATPAPAARPAKEPDNRKRRLTFKENQELQQLLPDIDELERTIASVHADMARPEFYQQPGEQIAGEQARLKALEDQLNTSMMRWEELSQFAE